MGTGQGELPVSAFATLPENVYQGASWFTLWEKPTESLFLAINEATGDSPPLEGIGSKLKGGKQGREAGSRHPLPCD
jgi:hypothetical protein